MEGEKGKMCARIRGPENGASCAAAARGGKGQMAKQRDGGLWRQRDMGSSRVHGLHAHRRGYWVLPPRCAMLSGIWNWVLCSFA